MAKKTPKIQKLLEKMVDERLTHEQMVRFLLRGTGKTYDRSTRRMFDSNLYGNSNRVGVLERYCRRYRDGSWKVRRGVKVTGPFNPVRTKTVTETYADGWLF